MTQAEMNAIRQGLEARLTALHDAGTRTADDRQPVILDQSAVGRLSRIDSMQMQQMALATQRRRETDMQRIQSAIKRIDRGDYGFCVACDEPIAQKRLQADPAVPTCLDCAARQG